MGFRRGIVAVAVVTAATVVCGCTKASHPTQLSTASSSQPTAATDPASNSPVASVSPSVAPAVAVSSSAPSSPTTAGTSSSPATSLPAALSSSAVTAALTTAARAFFTDLDVAFATGDLTRFETLTSPGCNCRKAVATIAGIYAKHQRVVGVANTVRSIRVASLANNSGTVEAFYSISAGQIVDGNGNQISATRAEPNGHSFMFIGLVNGEWLVLKNTLLDPEA